MNTLGFPGNVEGKILLVGVAAHIESQLSNEFFFSKSQRVYGTGLWSRESESPELAFLVGVIF